MIMMKWFASGEERKKAAMALLTELHQSCKDQPVLNDFFHRYMTEVHNGNSIPLTLSTMQLELATLLSKNHLSLTQDQEEKVTELRQLSNIHYG